MEIRRSFSQKGVLETSVREEELLAAFIKP
jgi:hypothetical protein